MTEPHNPQTCPVCQDAISKADPPTAKLLAEGKIVYPHGQAISRDTYPALYDAVLKPKR